MPHWLLVTLFYYPIASIFLIGSVFFVAVWRLARRGTLLAAWLVCSIVLGFTWYVGTCSIPLTCDEGGVKYWRTVLPETTLIWASAFGVAALLMVRVRASHPKFPLSRKALLGGAAITVGFAGAHLMFYVSHLLPR